MLYVFVVKITDWLTKFTTILLINGQMTALLVYNYVDYNYILYKWHLVPTYFSCLISGLTILYVFVVDVSDWLIK